MKANRSGRTVSLRTAAFAWALVALAICGTSLLKLQAGSSQASYTEVEVHVVSVKQERPWWAFSTKKITPSTTVTVEYDGTERRLKDGSWVAEGANIERDYRAFARSASWAWGALYRETMDGLWQPLSCTSMPLKSS